MARTKAEIRAFLDSKVGHTCVDKSDARLNGQCVCLIKNLMEFLGVPNPYGARGNAKDAGDAYIAQGIGTAGRGWLTICINRSMGGGYGHIWCDLLNEANYESNGVIPLVTTKNTRPIQQAQQFVNFDKWIKEETDDMIEDTQRHYDIINREWHNATGRDLSRQEFRISFVGRDKLEGLTAIHATGEAARWQAFAELGKVASTDKWQQQIYSLQDALKRANAALDAANKQAQLVPELKKRVADAQKKADEALKKSSDLEAQQNATNAEAQSFITAVINSLRNLFKK